MADRERIPLIAQGTDLLGAHVRIAGLQIFETGDLVIQVLAHRGEGALLERL